jgi:hypothetical protein
MSDKLPLYSPFERVNVLRDNIIVSGDSVVEDSARNVIVSGEGNYVGDFCEDIALFNCSGCIVAPYSRGVTMLNCSGITEISSGTIYISNQTITSSSFNSSGTTSSVDVTFVTSATYTLTATDRYIVVRTSPCTITIPSWLSDLGSVDTVYDIKNNGGGDIDLTTSASNGIDYDVTAGINSTITLAQGDAVTLLVTQIGDGSGDTAYII